MGAPWVGSFCLCSSDTVDSKAPDRCFEFSNRFEILSNFQKRYDINHFNTLSRSSRLARSYDKASSLMGAMSAMLSVISHWIRQPDANRNRLRDQYSSLLRFLCVSSMSCTSLSCNDVCYVTGVWQKSGCFSFTALGGLLKCIFVRL